METYLCLPGRGVERVVENSTLSNPDPWMLGMLPAVDSGIRVEPEAYSSVFAATSIISGDVAGLPIELLRMDDGSRIPQINSRVELLNIQPNPLMTAFTFRETLQNHALLWGNGYAAIFPDAEMMIPLLPDRTYPDVDLWYRTGEFRYVTQLMSGGQIHLEPSEVLHIKGLGYDGLRGYSVIGLARNSFGLGLAAERYGNRHFRNNARPNIVVQVPKKESTDFDKLYADFERRHGGTDNAGRPLLVSPQMTVTPLPMSNEDSQFLQTREFQRTEVAQWFQLPAHFLGAERKGTSYNSIEAENRAYVSRTLRKWLNKWNAEFNVKLRTPAERSSMWKHNLADLLEADISTRAEVALKLRTGMIAQQNEARRMVGLNPVEGGDTFENPNTSTTATGGTTTEPTASQRGLIRAALAERLHSAYMRERDKLRRLKPANVGAFYDSWPEDMARIIGPVVGVAIEFGLISQSAIAIATKSKRESLAASSSSDLSWFDERGEIVAKELIP